MITYISSVRANLLGHDRGMVWQSNHDQVREADHQEHTGRDMVREARKTSCGFSMEVPATVSPECQDNGVVRKAAAANSEVGVEAMQKVEVE